jgi:hypothetical protein
MNILLAIPKILSVIRYGGTERIVWWLGKELSASGHKVYFLVKPGSFSEFATIIPYRNDVPFNRQVPADVDVVHLHYEPDEIPEKPVGEPAPLEEPPTEPTEEPSAVAPAEEPQEPVGTPEI